MRRGPSRLALAGVLLAVGCIDIRANPEHCTHKGGDAYCERSSQGSYCALDHCDLYDLRSNISGCVQEQPARGCWSPCGGGRSATQDDSCLFASTGTGSTTAPAGTTSGSSTHTVDDTETGCAQDCTEQNLVCLDGTCQPCSSLSELEQADAACAQESPGHPWCVGEACAACDPERDSCPVESPMCDPQTLTCVACQEHADCPDSACLVLTGACVPPQRVFWVDNTATGANLGTQDDPFTSLNSASLAVGSEPAVLIVLEKGQVYSAPLSLGGGATLILMGEKADQAPPVFRPSGGQGPFFELESGAALYLADVRVEGSQTAPAISGLAADLVIDQSRLIGNPGGAVLMQEGRVWLRNTIVSDNGAVDGASALEVVDAELSLSYLTLVQNGGPSDAEGLRCTGAGTRELVNGLVRSSNDDTTVDCEGLVVTTSVTEPGLGGLELPYQSAWFRNPSNADYRLVTNAGAVGELQIGAWMEGLPTIDLENAPRPTDGPDYVGADRP